MIPIVKREQMREGDALAIQNGTDERELMLRAGIGIFQS